MIWLSNISHLQEIFSLSFSIAKVINVTNCYLATMFLYYFAKSSIFAKYIGHHGLAVRLSVCLSIGSRSTRPHHWTNRPDFVALPAERQRSFSNADSSVVRRRPSSTLQLKAWFLKNCLITFFLFWHVHVASLGWYQCIVKIWIWLNHPKGHFKRSERSNLAPF